MKETPLEQNELQLCSKYRISFDKLNVILTKRYQKRDGRGKNANLIDEYGYDKANASYFGNMTAFKNRLMEKEFLEELSEQDKAEISTVVEAIDKAIIHIDKVKEEIFNHITEHVTIDLGDTKKGNTRKVKGMEISSDLGDE